MAEDLVLRKKLGHGHEIAYLQPSLCHRARTLSPSSQPVAGDKSVSSLAVILVGNFSFYESSGETFRETKRCIGLAPQCLGSDPVLPVQ